MDRGAYWYWDHEPNLEVAAPSAPGGRARRRVPLQEWVRFMGKAGIQEVGEGRLTARRGAAHSGGSRVRRPLKIAAAVLLSLSLGLHWAALQSVAWTAMFLQRVQTETMAEAFRTTFDGNHPCPLCLVVREGRAAEQPPTTPAGWPGNPVPKLELFLSAAPPVFVPKEGTGPGRPADDSDFHPRSEPPALPPPRFV